MSHSFVLGDLVIDHTIFVRDIKKERHQRGREGIYEVVRRSDIAGGAATTARILAALSSGQTYLWGLMGKSHWGSFRSILDQSQAVDGADNIIEFRGICDETEAQMNTVARLVITKESDGKEVFKFADRFEETGHLHVSPDKRETALHYLSRANEKLKRDHKAKLDFIVLNDFDMGALTPDIVARIATFAYENDISLFVNPRYDNQKYRAIKGTAIVSDLKDWCRLAKDAASEDVWRKKILNSSESLYEMAYRSFRYLGDFDYYIIRCDDVTTVFIGPSMDEKVPGQYMIWKIPTPKAPQVAFASAHSHQIGVGGVITATFAMEFHKLVKPADQSHVRAKSALQAFAKANAIGSVYRNMPWNRMPHPTQIEEALQRFPGKVDYDLTGESYTKNSFGVPRRGMMYLPKNTDILLSEYRTCLPRMYSKPKSEFAKSLEHLLADCFSENTTKHLLLLHPVALEKRT